MIVFFAQVYANKTIKYVLYSPPLERNVSVNGNKQAIQAYIVVPFYASIKEKLYCNPNPHRNPKRRIEENLFKQVKFLDQKIVAISARL